jgi:hypothetical protein
VSDPTAVDAILDYCLALTVPSAEAILDELPTTSQSFTDFVLVGDDGDPSAAESDSGSSALARAAFEGETRDEVGDVILAVICQSGRSDASDLKACRDGSKTTLAELVAALGADQTLGGAVADSWVSGVGTVQGRTQKGAYVRRVVTLSFEAL